MTTRNLLILSTVALSLFFTSCKDKVEDEPNEPETSQLSVCVQPVFGSEILYLDSTYMTAEGYGVQFTDLKFFAEDVRGPVSQLKDASFFDYRGTGIALFTAEGSPDDHASLDGNLGVQASLNNSDPSAFPNDNVLNISNSGGMHWGWNPGYIFIKVEAKVDTIPDGVDLFDHNVIFHIGKNENLQTFSFSNINWQQTGDLSYNFPLKLDLQQFLQNGSETIDLQTEFTSHTASGQEALSTKVIQNFNAAISEY
ncbi:MAG: MbnP family protein [Crocinitomicaceae bacterium]